jgi:hypothetical protein
MAFFCTSDDYKYTHEMTSNKKIISSKLKFYPPAPSYKIINKQKNETKVNYEILPSLPYTQKNIPDWINISLYSWNIENSKSNIIYIHIENTFQKKLFLKNEDKIKNPKRKVILYSHENGKDLFMLLPFLIDLSMQIKCDIISYDFIGFGCSSGKPTEKNFIDIYPEIMNIAINSLNYQIENILLMGKDIGAMHSLIFASRSKNINCKGLILISPVIYDKKIDINIMKGIICPTLLIFPKGIDDAEDNNENQIVSFCREIPNLKEWYPKDKHMNVANSLFYTEDIILKHRKKFINLIREYMKSNNEEKNRVSGSAKSTNTETSPDNVENCFEYNENKYVPRKSKKDLIQEFEKEEKINYNNDDY